MTNYYIFVFICTFVVVCAFSYNAYLAFKLKNYFALNGWLCTIVLYLALVISNLK